MGSRRVAMKHRRRKARAIGLEMRAMREDKIARRKEALDAQKAAKMRKMSDYRARMAAQKKGGSEGAGAEGSGGKSGVAMTEPSPLNSTKTPSPPRAES